MPLEVVGAEPLVTAQHVVFGAVLKAKGVDVPRLQLLPVFLFLLHHRARHNASLERQNMGDLSQDFLHLFELAMSPHLHNDPPSAQRKHVVIDRPLSAAHAVTLPFLGDALPGLLDAPDGKHAGLVHLSVDGEADHLEMTPA